MTREAGNRCFLGRLRMWRRLLGAHASSLTDLRGSYKHRLHSAGQVWLLLGGSGWLQANTLGKNYNQEMDLGLQIWKRPLRRKAKGRNGRTLETRFPGVQP